MKLKNKCLYCGKWINPIKKNQKFCSDGCEINFPKPHAHKRQHGIRVNYEAFRYLMNLKAEKKCYRVSDVVDFILKKYQEKK